MAKPRKGKSAPAPAPAPEATAPMAAEPAAEGAGETAAAVDQVEQPEPLAAGDVVLVELEGNRLHGKKGTINSIEGDQAEVYHFEGAELQREAIPLANLARTELDAAAAPVAEAVDVVDAVPSLDDDLAELALDVDTDGLVTLQLLTGLSGTHRSWGPKDEYRCGPGEAVRLVRAQFAQRGPRN